jgi:hypothetical protein
MILGYATAVGDRHERPGKSATSWQWLKLDWGQTILAKLRSPIRELPKTASPVRRQIKARTTPSEQSLFSEDVTHRDRVPPGLQEQRLDRASKRGGDAPNLDALTDQVIKSGFRPDLIGGILLRLAEQERGIEFAGIFAGIIAKARKAREAQRTRAAQ